jgi:hypothetical protein
VYIILFNYIVFNGCCGYGVLEHLNSYLGAYALRYYYKLEVVYNKYYLKQTTIISHKPTFVRRGPIPNTIEKRVKEESMETQLWAHRLEDLLDSCVIKDVVKEAMASINWCCATKKAKFACGQSTFRKDPHRIMSYRF